MQIKRLDASLAEAIVQCFTRVYGDSYANELFYDVVALTEALQTGQLCSVGAVNDQGQVLGHMAMVAAADAIYPELGNTVVDPRARGGGIAWQIGDELTRWCSERGYTAYLHYPTTDHHIMQRQSVKYGFETGLMLGYIPAETDGHVKVAGADPHLRQAATIVVNPLAKCAAAEVYVPQRYRALLADIIAPCGLERRLHPGDAAPQGTSKVQQQVFARRGLARLSVAEVGADCRQQLQALLQQPAACWQVDFLMSAPDIDAGVEWAAQCGFVFCGWLPGFAMSDVLRMQKCVAASTNLQPGVINPVAKTVLAAVQAELRAQPTQS